MTDLEITKLCAEAYFDTGKRTISCIGDVAYVEPYCEVDAIRYDPLHDDAQAMALVKKFKLQLTWNEAATEPRWDVFPSSSAEMLVARLSGLTTKRSGGAHNEDLNRAICECVAKMQQARGTG